MIGKRFGPVGPGPAVGLVVRVPAVGLVVLVPAVGLVVPDVDGVVYRLRIPSAVGEEVRTAGSVMSGCTAIPGGRLLAWRLHQHVPGLRMH